MDKVRVDNGIKKIEVNDNGDYIELPMRDQSFPTRFFAFVDKIIARYEGIGKEEVDLMSAEGQYRKMNEVAVENMKDIDELLGEGTCKKVFGDIIPDDFLIIEFFEQLTPYIHKYGKARRNEIRKKYAPKGAKR